MKVIRVIYLVALIIIIGCSNPSASNEAENNMTSSKTRKEVLKRFFIYQYDKEWNNLRIQSYENTGKELPTWSSEEELHQKVQNQTEDIQFRRVGVLLISRHQSEDTDRLLINLLSNDSDSIVCLNAARALAYRESKEGVELLRRFASGELVVSSSGFERDAAAMALLLLDEGLPKEYLEWPGADNLYLMLAEGNW